MLDLIDQRTCLLPGQCSAPSRRGLDQTVPQFPAFCRAQLRRAWRFAAKLVQVETDTGPQQAVEDARSAEPDTHFRFPFS